MKKYRAIGVMSGTSLDGLDIALCEFEKPSLEWKYSIHYATTIHYTKEWKDRLSKAHVLSGNDLMLLNNEFGNFIGEQIKKFLKSNKQKVDFIASHGHTVFHQPEKKLTLQIGSGAVISAVNSIPTISDFRILDMALNGQGAPLVPIGDMLLFPDYHYCVNLGGFANLSYNWQKKRIAYDICPVNIIINSLAQKIGLEFDKDGKTAHLGNINDSLLSKLNKIKFYNQEYPKSLSREWLENDFLPIVTKSNLSINDQLRTIYEHIAIQIGNTIKSNTNRKVLVTGGGAYNKFLIQLIKKHTNHKIIIPDNKLVDFKEALVFAFLGTLRIRNENNCLASVTGARHDNIGGVIYQV